jgi:hypothetical protein
MATPAPGEGGSEVPPPPVPAPEVSKPVDVDFQAITNNARSALSGLLGELKKVDSEEGE